MIHIPSSALTCIAATAGSRCWSRIRVVCVVPVELELVGPRRRVFYLQGFGASVFLTMCRNYGNILGSLNVRIFMDILLSAEQSRTARALLNWSRVRLAAKANLSEPTISDFENGLRRPNPGKLAAIRAALEGAGVVFPDGGCPSLTFFQGEPNAPRADNRGWRRRRQTKSPAAKNR